MTEDQYLAYEGCLKRIKDEEAAERERELRIMAYDDSAETYWK
ncbi:hypothetical protein [Lentibacillus salicampi]|nr:hypothetical protein [Lentibacillus salicampi]